MLKQLKKPQSEGFTIIEVMIVLAIAGLIMLIVFLAVPALQRNSRNTQRKSDSSHLAGLISDYASNNNGKLPTAGFGSGANQLSLTGESWSIITAPTTITAATGAGYTFAAPTTDTPSVFINATCNGNVPQYNASTRTFVIYYYIEGATATQCLQG